MRLLTLSTAIRALARERLRPIPEPLVFPSLKRRESWSPRVSGLLPTILAGVVLAACSPNSDNTLTTNKGSSHRSESEVGSELPPPDKANPDRSTAIESVGGVKPPEEKEVQEPRGPKILSDRIVKPGNDKLAKIEHLLDRSAGIKIMRDWGLEVRTKSNSGHVTTLIACRLVGPGLEDGPIGIFTYQPITPVNGLAREFSDTLPNRHWSMADKAAQIVSRAAKAVQDGRAKLLSDQ